MRNAPIISQMLSAAKPLKIVAAGIDFPRKRTSKPAQTIAAIPVGTSSPIQSAMVNTNTASVVFPIGARSNGSVEVIHAATMPPRIHNTLAYARGRWNASFTGGEMVWDGVVIGWVPPVST